MFEGSAVKEVYAEMAPHCGGREPVQISYHGDTELGESRTLYASESVSVAEVVEALKGTATVSIPATEDRRHYIRICRGPGKLVVAELVEKWGASATEKM